MCKISVIIPTHNRADLLPRAIKSVQEQTYPVDEIIVVSDGSTDNTDEVVKDLQRSDGRIKLISYHPGHNGNYARNQGLAAATGDYIAFLDDDDEWLPQKNERTMSVFRQNPEYGVVYTAQHCIYTDMNYQYDTTHTKHGDLSKQILFRNYLGSPSQVMIKAEVLKKTGHFDLKLEALQDYDLWIRCCQVAKIGCVTEPCINYYNCGSSNQVSSNTEKYIRSKNYIDEKYSDIISSLTKEEQRTYNALNQIIIAKRCLRNGEKKHARACVVKSMKIKPSKQGLALFAASLLPYKLVVKARSKMK